MTIFNQFNVIQTDGTSTFNIRHDVEVTKMEHMSIDSCSVVGEDFGVDNSIDEDLKEEYWPFLE